MKHIKTLNTTDIKQHSEKRADAASARHHVSQLARHPAQLETRHASTANNMRLC